MKNYIGISRDHSRSMTNIAQAAGRDYNETIEAIRESASEHNIDTIVSVVKCGVGYHGDIERAVVISNVSVLQPIDKYVTDGGSTPLFDSVGDLIEQFESLPDADSPGVTFVIMAITDGEDNSSRRWTGQRLSTKMSQLMKTDRWTFVFRVPRGTKAGLVRMGIPSGNILEWEQTDRGIEQSTVATRSAVKDFYHGLSSGTTGTGKFYPNLDTVSLTEVKSALVDVSDQVDVYIVGPENDGVEIRDFVEAQGLIYVKGCAFYQLSKTESVQSYKQIAIRDKMSGAVYAGVAARNLIGLPAQGDVKLAPGQHGQYEIYVQSTSFNRKLSDGTNVMVWRRRV